MISTPSNHFFNERSLHQIFTNFPRIIDMFSTPNNFTSTAKRKASVKKNTLSIGHIMLASTSLDKETCICKSYFWRVCITTLSFACMPYARKSGKQWRKQRELKLGFPTFVVISLNATGKTL